MSPDAGQITSILADQTARDPRLIAGAIEAYIDLTWSIPSDSALDAMRNIEHVIKVTAI